MASLERYVPVGRKALSSDAPGWNTSNNASEKAPGPTCWKCKGQREVVDKASKLKNQQVNGNPTKRQKVKKPVDKILKACTVCDGKGFIPPKKKEMTSLSAQVGMITRQRKYPEGWKVSGPTAHAVEEMHKTIEKDGELGGHRMSNNALLYLHQANTVAANDAGVSVPSIGHDEYPWYPSNSGEQLCNLVGSWRILQRIGSHRWTTDDIVTAQIAIQQVLKEGPARDAKLRYLDLGCGNGSVLQMVGWGLLEKFNLKAYGIEARSEAAGLARRSISFNIGKDCKSITVIHGDFRDLERDVPFGSIERGNTPEQLKAFYDTKGLKFDLVTGTPPYFQVDFSTKDLSNGTSKFDKMVTSAVINQGGMPTSVQSAPARCEFRGGIEEYCQAAATVLSDNGSFVVCENWLNNGRVYEGAKLAKMKVVRAYPVKGKDGRKENLFGVYLLKKKAVDEPYDQEDDKNAIAEPISVRTKCGKWTAKYAALLETMAIPAHHLAL